MIQPERLTSSVSYCLHLLRDCWDAVLGQPCKYSVRDSPHQPPSSNGGRVENKTIRHLFPFSCLLWCGSELVLLKGKEGRGSGPQWKRLALQISPAIALRHAGNSSVYVSACLTFHELNMLNRLSVLLLALLSVYGKCPPFTSCVESPSSCSEGHPCAFVYLL